MLCLSRGLAQKVVIGEGPNQVVVEIVRIDPFKVRLGITAAKHIPIHRQEIHEIIQAAKAESAA